MGGITQSGLVNKIGSSFTNKLEEARAMHKEANNAYESAEHTKNSAFLNYVQTCARYAAKYMEVYYKLKPDEIEESLDSLTKVAEIVCRYEPTSGMSRGEKAAYTRKLNNLKKQDAELPENMEYVPAKGALFTGKNARKLRDTMGYSRPQLAKKLGMSRSYITKIEQDKSGIGGLRGGEKAKKYFNWFTENAKKMKG